MTLTHATLERVSRDICDSRNGAAHFDAKGTHRNHWRTLAFVEIERRRGISLGDALMGIFGDRRVRA